MDQALLLSDKSEEEEWRQECIFEIQPLLHQPTWHLKLSKLHANWTAKSLFVPVSPLDYKLQSYEKSCFQISFHIYPPFWLKMTCLFYSHDKYKSTS